MPHTTPGAPTADEPVTTVPARERGPAWLAAALWVVVGLGVALGISQLGLFTVPTALVTTALLLTLGPRWAAAGLLACAAACVMVVGSVGASSSETTSCTAVPDGAETCTTVTSRSDGVPWFVAGAVLAVACAAVVVHAARAGRRAHRDATARPATTPRAASAVVLMAPLALAATGLLPLWIAWLNRDGPGEVCRTWAGGQECTQEWSPWPWLATGVVLLAAGLGLLVLVRRRRSRPAGGG